MRLYVFVELNAVGKKIGMIEVLKPKAKLFGSVGRNNFNPQARTFDVVVDRCVASHLLAN